MNKLNEFNIKDSEFSSPHSETINAIAEMICSKCAMQFGPDHMPKWFALQLAEAAIPIADTPWKKAIINQLRELYGQEKT